MQLQETNYDVTPGEIIVNSGWEVLGEYKVLSFDLQSKYADVLSWSSDDNYPILRLWADERTLKTNEEKKNIPTEIKLKDYRGWNVLGANIGRYTLTVFLEKYDNENT